MIEETGFVPVTADDVVTPGGNINAKLDTLIHRASVVVVEISSWWTIAEYRMAIARLRETRTNSANGRRLHIIVIVTNFTQVPQRVDDISVIMRPDIVAEDQEEFLSELRNRLHAIAEEIDLKRPSEPWRLFEAKEYRAAVISAMTRLEETLRDRIKKDALSEVGRPSSLRWLIDVATQQQIISPTIRERALSWIRTRNETVHSSSPITRAKAREIIEGAFQIVDDLA